MRNPFSHFDCYLDSNTCKDYARVNMKMLLDHMYELIGIVATKVVVVVSS